MKKIILIVVLFITATNIQAQTKFFTKAGKITFDATSPSSPDKIYGTNDKATSVIDAASGAMEFALLMKAFAFDKALMQEHFNENYVESDKFPKAVFKGSITNMKEVNLQKDGSYPIKVKGNLTMHGVTKEITVDLIHRGTIQNPMANNADVAGLQILGTIKRSDFNIGSTFPDFAISDEVRIKADGEFSKK